MNRTFWPAAALGAVMLGLVALPRPALASICSTISGNLVQNCGFDNGLAAWTASGNTSVSGSPDFAYSGASGVAMGQTGGALGAYDTLSQAISTFAGTTYDIGVWLDPSGLTPSDFMIQWDGATLLDLANDPTGFQTTGSPQWVYEMVGATGTGSDTLTIGSEDSSPAGISDVAVVAASPPPTACNAVNGNPVGNCGFGNGSTSLTQSGTAVLPVVVNNGNPIYISPAILIPNPNGTSINGTNAGTAGTSGNLPQTLSTVPGTSYNASPGFYSSGSGGNNLSTVGNTALLPNGANNSPGLLTTGTPPVVSQTVAALGTGTGNNSLPPGSYSGAGSASINNISTIPVAAGSGTFGANPSPAPVPEPTSLIIFGTALIGFGWLHRRKRAA